MNKKILIGFIALILAVVAVLIYSLKENGDEHQNQIGPNKSYFRESNKFTGGRKEVVSFTESQKEIVNTFSVNDRGRKRAIAAIQYASSRDPVSEGSGIIVFDVERHPEIIWETSYANLGEMFIRYPDKLIVEDVNKDGSLDLISLWHDGARLDALVMYMFSWKEEGGFKELYFLGKNGRRESSIGATSINMDDVDGDAINEIIAKDFVPIFDSGGKDYTTQDDTVGSNIVTSIYKFNGIEYYLWKEETQKENN